MVRADTRSIGIRRPSALNEYVESHPTNAAPVTVPPFFSIVTPSSRTPAPSNRSDAAAFSKGSVYAVPPSMVMPPKPIGCS